MPTDHSFTVKSADFVLSFIQPRAFAYNLKGDFRLNGSGAAQAGTVTIIFASDPGASFAKFTGSPSPLLELTINPLSSAELQQLLLADWSAGAFVINFTSSRNLEPGDTSAQMTDFSFALQRTMG